MSHPPSTRRRGGQPGNVNRLKHGLYSRRLSPPAAGRAISPTETPDPRCQLALARRRLAQLLDLQDSAGPHEYLSYERGISRYLSLISEFWCKSVRPAQPGTVGLERHDGHPFVGMLEALPLLDPDASRDPKVHLNPIRTSSDSPEDHP